MPQVKKWSTGSIGNPHPDHSERGNPNTRGLSIDGVPGIEGYIEEDRVVADQDNRPLENLTQNDLILEDNLAAVASEVDYGVLRYKDQEFRIEVLTRGDYPDPEDGETIEISPLRIHAGQAIVDGQVTAVGRQKISYFLRDDGSYLFPDYAEHEGKTVIPVIDDLYSGDYKPVYDTVAEGLPENFENYEIRVVNKYDTADDRITFFKVYRNWEDIIPYAPYFEETEANLNFVYDENYGRESEGVWLQGDDINNLKISNVVVKKNIEVKDKKLDINNFIENGSSYGQYIITDGIFFDNVPWRTETQEKKEVQSLYVPDDGSLYFAYKHEKPRENLFYLPNGSTQVSNIALRNSQEQGITKIVEAAGVLFLLGTNGYFATYNLTSRPDSITEHDEFPIDSSEVKFKDEDFKYVTYWQGRIWIATDKNIYHISLEEFGPSANSFTKIEFASEIDTISNATDLLREINVLKTIRGNFFVDSSLKTSVVNHITNPSFEKGGIGTTPSNWEASGTFTLSPSNAKYGNYKGVIEATSEAYQEIKEDFAVGSTYTLSSYFRATVDSQVDFVVEELNSNGDVVTSSIDSLNVVGDNAWNRLSATPYTISNDINNVRVRIANNSANTVQIDCVQFEEGVEVNQFVEGFEYLLVGFRKNNTDNHNPPFALIDSKRLDQINYAVGYYGDIKTVNDGVFNNKNEFMFIDDRDIYCLVILNDEDEYNRVTITNITKNNEDLNLKGNIDELTTIESFGDRIFFGGKILNKAVSFDIVDTEEDHVVNILTVDNTLVQSELDPNTLHYNITDVLGDYRIIPAHGETGARVEFARTEEVYESRGSFGIPGAYDPGRNYVLAIQIDDQEPIVITIDMPRLYEGPISIEEIYDRIIAKYPQNDVVQFNLDYSNSKVDGLYSIGKNRLTRHIRGDIQQIFKQKNIHLQNHYDKGIYIILEDAILKSKFDPNVKKLDSGDYISQPETTAVVGNITELPLTASFGDVYHVKDFGYYRWNGSDWVDTQYIYKWNLDPDNHALREFKSKYNIQVQFSDESQNKNWIDLPISTGYKLVSGSLRVKTNAETEIGFSENEDYFVDYENGKIIRSTLQNYLQDSNFEYVDSAGTSWETYREDTVDSTFNLEKKIDSYYSHTGEERIIDSYGSVYIDTPNDMKAAAYQFVKPASLNVDDTYTFSIKLKTNKKKSGTIAISECVSDAAQYSTKNDTTETQYSIGGESTDDSLNEWHYYTVSHTITNSSSSFVRVEINMDIESDIPEQLFVKEAQLERNQIATPYVSESMISRIDAGSTVYVDFTETKDLTSGVDYTFDTANRKVVYHGDLTEDTELYFDYQYEKIFNPYLFRTSIPKFDISYDDRDDYFLYLYAGRVWAINFVLSLLSQDEENPLVISYDYSYPRIDKVKIRNKPDQYGNYIYLVKGEYDPINPYGPYDKGTDRVTHTIEVDRDKIEDTESNDMLYEINVVDTDYDNNDIYDRRVYVDSRENRYFNISLYDQTVGYFPYTKDFMSTSGMNPLNRLYNSKIVDIIKNFNVKQLEEIGAWGPNYQLALRSNEELPYPSIGLALFVDINTGNDTNDGDLRSPLKTIKEAIRRIEEYDASPYIIVKSESLITEDIEINHTKEIQIFAQTYARWKGNIQNRTPLGMKGFQFERHNFYVISDLRFHYCTFINSTVNNYIPKTIEFKNCRIEDSSNTFLYVKNTIFPSPFLHPYQRNVGADDGISGNPESVATSDTESIHPSVGSYLSNITGNPSGSYKFFRCLIDGSRDDLIRYELKEFEPWISEFEFERCTIVNNKNLFYSNKSSQIVNYVESIIWNNGETRGEETKYFDSLSNISFQNSYIDFSRTGDSDQLNFNPLGLIFGRETCVNGQETQPGFISTQDGFENYRLWSEAMGYLTNSVCVGRAADGRDLGCYDELRERLDVEVPKKLKSYFALVGEGIHYPIILNSEKITFTLEFKPTKAFSSSAVLFDTRSHPNDKDYIVVVYNNNSGDKIADIDEDPDAVITDPYTFKIIVVNEKTRYVVVSPVRIYSDADYQVWHKLSFTVNYEKTFNGKMGFDEKDKYQNIITMFHNEQLAVESFLKNDLSYDEKNNLLEGYNNDDTNDWNYNDISSFITVGSTYDQQHILNGYYSELRIDNRFINRKELEAWNRKVVPFNDPISYVDQNNLARTFDSSMVNDIWTLRTKYDVGAKGHKFNKHTHKRFTYDNGEFTWVLTGKTTNFIENADLSESIFASVTTDVPPNNDTEDLFPVSFNGIMNITAIGGNTFDSSTGVVIDFTDSGMNFYSHDELFNFIMSERNKIDHTQSKIQILKLKDNRFRVFTQDYRATQIKIVFENGGDAEEFGFSTLTGDGNGYTADNGSDGEKTITGGKNTSIEITSGISQDMEDVHQVWTEFDPEYSRFGKTSLGISRTITYKNNDDPENDEKDDKYIRIITHRIPSGQHLAAGEENKYTYSVYIYRRNNEFSKDDVKLIVQELVDAEEKEFEYDFDSIENIYGYWWLASKEVYFQHEAPTIGLIVKGEVEMYLDAFQLEDTRFATPFVLNSDSHEGMIEVDKALLNDTRGLLFFRFKPLFKPDTRERKILLEALAGRDNDGVEEADPEKGFKVWYEYDEELGRGKIQFRTALIEDVDNPDALPDEAAWEVLTLDQFWNDWHTIVISYDFEIKRFIYFFDYFKTTVDVSIPQYPFFTNLSIGRDAILGFDENGEPEFPLASASADIMVRDVLITNYIVSDNEINNWINANEFYKESIFNSLLDSYQVEMYGAIERIEGITNDTHNIEQNINMLSSRVSSLEGVVDTDINLTLLKVQQEQLRNEVYNDNIGILAKIDILDGQRQNHDGRIIENRNDNISQDVLIQENTDNIAQEVSDRAAAISNLLIRLAAHTLGDGASMIGVHDPSNRFAENNVEAVLLEIENRVNVNEINISNIETDISDINATLELMQHGDGSVDVWTTSKATNNGWNIQSLRADVDSNDADISGIQTNLAQEILDRQDADTQLEVSLTSYIDTNIEDLAGSGRTIETIKGNWDLIQTNILSISDLTINLGDTTTELNKVKDGTDGTSWVDTMNLVDHDSRIDSAETTLSTHTTDIQTNTTNIADVEGRTTNLETALTQEVSDRQSADTSIINNLASISSGLGASLVGIEDAADSFASENVEGALQEIDAKLQALAGSINWQASVMTTADLPTSNNNLNDARIVQDDGDGSRAQYVWNGTSWVKVADVDWGEASGITYNNTESGLLSTDVKSAIDELYERSVSPNNNQVQIPSTGWSSDSEGFYYDFSHGLETMNIAARAVDSSGVEIGVDEYERLDKNTLRVRVAETVGMSLTIFGAHNSYSKIIGNWTLSGGIYVKDIVHGFGTRDIMISAFNVTTGERVGLESIETLDENAVRVMTTNNSDVLNVFILRQTSNATTKDIEYWVANGGMYETALPLALDYDAVYSFYDPSENKTVGVDTVKFESGLLKIRRTENTPLRMVVLK